MSHPVSTAEAPAAAANAEEAASPDGWRSGGLPALRAELDKIDNAIHDLLMQRARVVEHVARSGKPAAFRPGREAAIIRRLLARHQGALPAVTLVRLWREMLAGTTGMQGKFSLAVCDQAPSAPVAQLAREHFGVLTPLHTHGSVEAALDEVASGNVAVAVLAYPSADSPWWTTLESRQPRLHIIARLPFWRLRPEGVPQGDALVVAPTPADASGEDRALLALECDAAVSMEAAKAALADSGLDALTMIVSKPGGATVANLLVEVEGALADEDPRLGRLASRFRRCSVLGTYATPVPAQPATAQTASQIILGTAQ